jgi:hypothetical protein
MAGRALDVLPANPDPVNPVTGEVVAREIAVQTRQVSGAGQHKQRDEELGQADNADLASRICRIPEKPTGPRASPLDHSWITHSRHRTALGGHQRTPAWSISYSRGRRGILSDTGGHASDTVRDREARGSNGPPDQNPKYDPCFTTGARRAPRSWRTGGRRLNSLNEVFATGRKHNLGQR